MRDADPIWQKLPEGHWFLPGVLCGTALIEFLVSRVLQPAASVALAHNRGLAVLDLLSRFSLNLVAVLGIFITGMLLFRATRPGGAAANPVGKLSIWMLGGLLVILATVLVMFPTWAAQVGVIRRAQWLLQLSAVCVAVLTVLGVLPRYAPPTLHKLALLLILLPGLLQLELQWGLITSGKTLQRYGLLSLMYGPLLAMCTLAAGALLLSPRQVSRQTLIALCSAAGVVICMALSLVLAPSAATRLIYLSYDLRLPLRIDAQILYLLCLSTWIYATAALLLGSSQARITGAGLLLVGLAGCQAKTVHQLLFFVSGILLVAEGLLWPLLLAYQPSLRERLAKSPSDTASASSAPSTAEDPGVV